MMVAVLLLAALSGYLAMRLHAAKVENDGLRMNIAQLKRRWNQRA
jgi:hypothetical protein